MQTAAKSTAPSPFFSYCPSQSPPPRQDTEKGVKLKSDDHDPRVATDGAILPFAVLLEQPGRSLPPGRGSEIMGVMEGLRTGAKPVGVRAGYPIPHLHSQKAHRFPRVLVDLLRPQHSEFKSAPPTLTCRFNLRRNDEEYTRQSWAHPASAASRLNSAPTLWPDPLPCRLLQSAGE